MAILGKARRPSGPTTEISTIPGGSLADCWPGERGRVEDKGFLVQTVNTLSVRHPWVDLILVSRKTIEVRRWPTDNGGRLWTPAFGWKSCW